MPIINTLPNTIANGQLEDAVPVMANFNWILSQVNGNACPATSGSSILKGNGTGGTISAVAGTDYAGITSVNTFTQLQSGIAAVSDANFPIASQVQASAFNTGTTGGTVDAITATFAPVFTALVSAPVWWRATGANTSTTPTFKRDGLVAKTIVKGSNQALVAGDIPGAGAWMCSQYDATLDKEVLLNPATSASSVVSTNISGGAAGSVPYQTAANTTTMLAAGINGQLLTLAGGVPAWTAAPFSTVTDQTASRSYGATYTNSTGKPMFVAVNGLASSTALQNITGYVGATLIINSPYTANTNWLHAVAFIVPAGATYKVTATSTAPTLSSWIEIS